MRALIDQAQSAALHAAYNARNLGSKQASFLRSLETSQWWSEERVKSAQWQSLKQLLSHAYQHVPYYESVFHELRITPDDVRTPEDLAQLPLLTKQIIQEQGQNLIARNADLHKCKVNHSGGSEGKPLTFYQGPEYVLTVNPILSYNYHMCGYREGDKVVFLWGSDYDSRRHKGQWARWRNRLFYNVLWVNAFNLSQESLESHALDIAAFRPRFIVAYVSSIALLARATRDLRIPGINPEAIQVSAETLSTDQRRLIEETFGCRVFNRYGCREVGNLAHECDAHQGLHLMSQLNYVELVRDGRPAAPGEEGAVIATSLRNYAMPFIRYAIGDMAVASGRRCACGRGLPMVESVTGRISDHIVSPSGKLLHGEFFSHLFYNLEGVRQFQVVQETPELLQIKIAPMPGFDQPAALAFLEQTIHHHGDDRFIIEFDICDHIDTSASGKYRFTMSKVSPGN